MIKTPWGIFLNARQDAAHIILSRLVSLYPTGFTFFSHPAKDTFQLSLTLLVNYRSRVVFRIGSFCLPYSRDFQRTLLFYSHVVISGMVTGLSPSLAVPFQATSPSLT